MSLIDRYKNWRESKEEDFSWVSYRLFHHISDKVPTRTSYSGVLKSAAIREPSRIYVSKVLFIAVFIWLLLSILSNLLVVPSSWISALIGLGQFIVSITSLPLILGGVADGVLTTFQTVAEVGASVNYQSIVSYVESSLRSLGQSFSVIGAILLAAVTIFDSVLEPLFSISQDVLGRINIQASTGGGTDILETVTDVTPDRAFIRNIVVLIIAPLISIIYIGYKIFWPYYTASERGRKIDNNLGRSYTFLHALSKGGLGTYEAMRELAEAEDAYGDVSVAFQKIVRNANKGDSSLSSAIREVAEKTPSDEFREFLNGLTNTIETGSDVSRYIESRAQRALEEARKKQENRLQMYELISEVYIIIFVAAPVFFIILQLVQAMAGSVGRSVTQMVPYLIIPVGGFMISAIIYLTGKQDNPEFQKLQPGKTSKWYDIKKHSKVEEEYSSTIRRASEKIRRLKNITISPIYKVRYKPRLTLVISLPLALLVILASIQLGYIPVSGYDSVDVQQNDNVDTEMSLMERVDSQYIEMTLLGIYAPFMIIAVPWMLMYESKRRKREKVVSQLPQLFSSIAEANKRGLTLQESIESTAMSSDSRLYNELQDSIRRSKFTNDLNGSLILFANRMRVPRLSQSIRLLAEANEVSSNVTVVVEKIADDLEAKYKLTSERKQRARIYVVIVFVSFFIGSAVLVALDVTFFEFIVNEIGGSGGEDVDTNRASYGQDLPVEFFRRVFLHTIIALGVVSGSVSGMMENGTPDNGLKYAIVMTTVGIIAFFTVPVLV